MSAPDQDEPPWENPSSGTVSVRASKSGRLPVNCHRIGPPVRSLAICKTYPPSPNNGTLQAFSPSHAGSPAFVSADGSSFAVRLHLLEIVSVCDPLGT